MWLADRRKDYEVIDCSDGEKLERWKKYILLRPDPQVIWSTPKQNKNWKKLNGHYHRSAKGGGEWEFFDLPQEWTINYTLPIDKELTFHLKPFSFKHTGLFPEQAANWDWFSQKIEKAVKSGLGDAPLFFLINSYTTGLQPAVLNYMISTVLKKYDGFVTAEEIGIPVSSNGLVLPCGASGRWEHN